MNQANFYTESAQSSTIELNLEPDTQLVTVDDHSPTVSVLWNRAVQQAVIDTSPGPTIASRAYSMVHTAMFDAWAAYDSQAISTQLGDDLQRPEADNTDANKTEAMSYAAYQVLVDLFPEQEQIFTELMLEMGFDPNNETNNTNTPAGVGNVSAQALLEFRHEDSSNQYADYSSDESHPSVNEPGYSTYVDHWTSEYVPIDSEDPDALVQEFLTPHWGEVTPFALESGDEFRPVPPEPFLLVEGEVDLETKTIHLDTGEVLPVHEDLIGSIINPEFIVQAETVVEASASLTDEQKLIAEFWEDGEGTSFPPGTWMTFGEFISARDDNSLDEDAQMFFALSNAVFDAGIATWESKTYYDYARPVRTIRTLGELGLIGEYNSELGGYAIEAWAGTGEGTQTILASEFMTYQTPGSHPSPPFAEYTSGHSAFSAAGAEILELFTDSDEFGASVTFESGESRFESGITPEESVTLEWSTFDEAADEAGISRIYGGIHFEDGDINSRLLGSEVGQAVWDEAQFYIQGGVETDTENTTSDTADNNVIDVRNNCDRFTGSDETVFASPEDDVLLAGSNHQLSGGDGDDSFYIFEGGNNLLTGDAGEDVFWISTGQLPNAANIISDFELGVDRIAISGIENVLSIDDVDLSQEANNTTISIDGQDIAIVQNLTIGELYTNNNFTFA